LSEDPADEPEGRERHDDGERGPETGDEGVDAALEPPPEADVTGHLERRVRLAEDRLSEVLAAYRRVKTENEGFRERVTRDLERRFDERRERLLLRFIDILDNLDRALEAAEQTFAGNPLIEGLILVRTQLLQTLQKEGLERIPVLGLPFNPAFSEAVGTQPVSDREHDHVVVRELLRGYRLNGRIARASRVYVGQYVEGADDESGESAAELAEEDLIGADEHLASPDASRVPDSEPLDEGAVEELLDDGGSDEDPDPEAR
jgi:molecular chaperone GrpE